MVLGDGMFTRTSTSSSSGRTFPDLRRTPLGIFVSTVFPEHSLIDLITLAWVSQSGEPVQNLDPVPVG